MDQIRVGRIVVTIAISVGIMWLITIGAVVAGFDILHGLSVSIFIALAFIMYRLFHGDKSASSTTDKVTNSRYELGKLVALIGGGAVCYYFLFFDISIPNDFGTRTVNLGRMADRQLGLIVGIALFFGGMLMTILSKTRGMQEAKRDERACPHCAERILAKANVCKHCGKDVQLQAVLA